MWNLEGDELFSIHFSMLTSVRVFLIQASLSPFLWWRMVERISSLCVDVARADADTSPEEEEKTVP